MFTWGGNVIVDTHAKLGAREHMVDAECVATTETALGVVKELATLLAQIGVWRLETYGLLHEHAAMGFRAVRAPRPPDVMLHCPVLGSLRCITGRITRSASCRDVCSLFRAATRAAS